MRSRLIAIAALLGCLLFSHPAAGERLAQLSLRYMVTEAGAIVEGTLGEPDAKAPTERPCTLTQVLRGDDLRAGQTITLELDLYSFEAPRWAHRQGEKPPQIKSVLLFLQPEKKPGTVKRPLASGIRALTADGRILRPDQPLNPGGYELFPIANRDWQAMLGKVRADVAEAQKAYDDRAIAEPAQRNAALFGWIREHQKEFCEYASRAAEPFARADEPRPATAPTTAVPEGWGMLQYQPFYWILQSNVLDDAWKALTLCDELNDVAEPSGVMGLGHLDTFASPQGRAFLLRILEDKAAGNRARRVAAHQLSRSMWPYASKEYPAAAPIDAREQERIIRALLPLLQSKDRTMLRHVVRVIASASCPPGYDKAKRMTSGLALPALKETLQRLDKNDASTSAAINEIIRRIEGSGKAP